MRLSEILVISPILSLFLELEGEFYQVKLVFTHCKLSDMENSGVFQFLVTRDLPIGPL
jgi:hypothetical protein